MLAASEHGEGALADRAVLADVVRHKKVFYDASYAKYNDCLSGSLRLIPDPSDLAGLEADYRAMVASGMFYTTPPTFDALLSALRSLETRINTQGDQ